MHERRNLILQKLSLTQTQKWLTRKIITSQNLPDLEKIQFHANTTMGNPENLTWPSLAKRRHQTNFFKTLNLKVKKLLGI